MKYINELELSGKTVFIRADLNVPLNEDGSIADAHRIKAALPTIQHAIEAGAKIVLASHLGRPGGKRDEKYSLAPVAKRLSELLNIDVLMAKDCVGEEVRLQAKSLAERNVLLLENLRFHAEEEENDAEFSKKLASLAEVYVNDAFATAHRAHASTAGITEYLTEKAGGFTMKDELEYFNKALSNPERPLLAIFGGAKVSTKMKAIKNVAKKADMVVVGGAMANTFFVAMGHGVGKSLYEKEEVESASEAIKVLKELNCELILPVDVLVASEFKAGQESETVSIDSIPENKMALDIGPKSVDQIRDAISRAKTIVWNGPMGAFEIDDFSFGTYGVVDALCSCKALTVVGGGDTDLALHKRNAFSKMDYVSTAGGAFLKLLEGKVLPAVEALNK